MSMAEDFYAPLVADAHRWRARRALMSGKDDEDDVGNFLDHLSEEQLKLISSKKGVAELLFMAIQHWRSFYGKDA